MKPLSNVSCKWSPNFAYAIGLITTDGNLSPDGRHINFTTKDYELAVTVKNIFGLTNIIGKKARSKDGEKKYFVLQFGDVNFYRFLLGIGLTPRKSKTLGAINIPKEYFFDFLRGCIDGDGNINEFSHPESQYLQLRVKLFSASREFLIWVQMHLDKYNIKGRICDHVRVYMLVYAMKSSKKLLNMIYYPGFSSCLQRKYKQAQPYLLEWRN